MKTSKRESGYKERCYERYQQKVLLSDFHFGVDLSYESFMNEREINSLIIQLRVLYALNQKAQTPVKISLFGLSSSPFTFSKLEQLPDFSSWVGVTVYQESIMEIFDRLKQNKANSCQELEKTGSESTRDCQKFEGISEIIYLSPDAKEGLQKVSKNVLYCAGGLVDRSRLKGLSNDKATQNGMKSVHLPVREFIASSNDQVLNISDVGHLISLNAQYCDWAVCFNHVSLNRKRISSAPKTSQFSSSSETEGYSIESKNNTSKEMSKILLYYKTLRGASSS
eukprot:TRINITY_DN7816_c0_g1_i1.p1 TRINITY_DN7816_c0_g1~~TRINITY_DN7816_c0_g1_i1.p1  ORF type:complete len:281 (-),score=44.47 TRINITY_DN7816_c0_g1_i1:53-895(-)